MEGRAEIGHDTLERQDRAHRYIYDHAGTCGSGLGNVPKYTVKGGYPCHPSCPSKKEELEIANPHGRAPVCNVLGSRNGERDRGLTAARRLQRNHWDALVMDDTDSVLKDFRAVSPIV